VGTSLAFISSKKYDFVNGRPVDELFRLGNKKSA
jgi:hypothetical protein